MSIDGTVLQKWKMLLQEVLITFEHVVKGCKRPCTWDRTGVRQDKQKTLRDVNQLQPVHAHTVRGKSLISQKKWEHLCGSSGARGRAWKGLLTHTAGSQSRGLFLLHFHEVWRFLPAEVTAFSFKVPDESEKKFLTGTFFFFFTE